MTSKECTSITSVKYSIQIISLICARVDNACCVSMFGGVKYVIQSKSILTPVAECNFLVTSGTCTRGSHSEGVTESKIEPGTKLQQTKVHFDRFSVRTHQGSISTSSLLSYTGIGSFYPVTNRYLFEQAGAELKCLAWKVLAEQKNSYPKFNVT